MGSTLFSDFTISQLLTCNVPVASVTNELSVSGVGSSDGLGLLCPLICQTPTAIKTLAT